MPALRIETAEVFEPLLEDARYKGAHGGRGSGKSHFFAELGVEDALRFPGDHGEGLRLACIREVQKSLKESAKLLIEDKLQRFGLGEAQGFKVFEKVIQLPGDGLVTFDGMQDHTAESFKSKEGFHRSWCEEAQTLTARSLQMLRPTIRKEQSQLWFSWNPRRKNDTVDEFLRGAGCPADAIVVRANWSDNPWFPRVLEEERREDFAHRRDQYGHVWEGDYATVYVGAYFAALLAELRRNGQIGRVAADPLMERRVYWDIGGTGAKADARSLWAVQFVGREVRALNYRETQGQPLSADVDWLRSSGYAGCHCVLPHDGETHDRVHDVSYESYLRSAGFPVTVIPNQGRGAAGKRIEAVRRILPSCWFNEATTAPGIDALAWYHERRDEARNVGLGPEHDWSSHGADAFGLMAVAYETHSAPTPSWPAYKPARVV